MFIVLYYCLVRMTSRLNPASTIKAANEEHELPPLVPSSAGSLPSIVPQKKKRLFKAAHLVTLVLGGLLLLVAIINVSSWNFLTELLQGVTEKLAQKPCNASSSGQYLLAYEQSFGLFDDIPNQMWKIMQRGVKEHENHEFPTDPLRGSNRGNVWYQQNYEPFFTCPHERRVGKLGKNKYTLVSILSLEEWIIFAYFASMLIFHVTSL